MEQGGHRAFTVEIRRHGDHYVGRLRDARAPETARQQGFEDADCGEVARSLSLVLALAIDPQAALALPPVPRRPAPAPPPVPPKAEPEPGPGPVTRPAPRRSGAPATPRRVAAPPRSVQAGAGALVFVQTGVASRPLVGAGLSLRLRAPRLGALRDAGVALQGLAAQTGVAGPQPPEATYRWIVARALVAPASIRPVPVMVVYPLLVVDAGSISGTGRSIAVPRTDSGLWASAGAGLGLDVRVGRGLSVNLSLNVQANLERHRFVFERPFHVVHSIPAASLGASLGLDWWP